MATSPETTNGESSAAGIAEEAKAKLGEIAEPLREKAEQITREHKEAGAGQMRTLASAVHSAARELEGERPRLANTVHDMAQRIDETANDLRTRDLNELMQKLEAYARQQPALVFGGAMVAGLCLSRFLKSSAANTQTAPVQS